MCPSGTKGRSKYTHLPVHTLTYLYIHSPTCTYTHLPVHTLTSLYIHSPTCTYIQLPVHTFTYLYIHSPTCTYTHLPVHTFTYMYIHSPTCIYTYLAVHTQIYLFYTQEGTYSQFCVTSKQLNVLLAHTHMMGTYQMMESVENVQSTSFKVMSVRLSVSGDLLYSFSPQR